MGEKDAWKKQRSEGSNVLNIKCWETLDLDKVKSKGLNLGESYCLLPNSPSFDNSLHILHVHTANSKFVKGSIYGARLTLPLLFPTYTLIILTTQGKSLK